MKSATDMVLERLLVRKRSKMVCLSADSWHCGIQKGTDNGNGTSLMSASITSLFLSRNFLIL